MADETALIVHTLIASIESVANAAILATMGWYLHIKGFMTKPGKKLLAEMSQNVTFPMMLFTSILYCRQGITNVD
jgi:predicted permease